VTASATACTHALLRRITPGGRCPVCRPRENSVLAALEQAITPQRLIVADARIELADAVKQHDEAAARKLEADIARMRAEIEIEERNLARAGAAEAVGNFRLFLELMWPHADPSGRSLVPNPGTDALALHAQALEDGEIKLCGIACAPGFGKSSVFSVGLPAWLWVRNPARRIICASHAYELARDLGSKFLRLVETDWYRADYPEVAIASDAVTRVETEIGGQRFAVGVEGALTGIRGTFGIVDDSLNAVDAASRARVKAVNEWYEGALLSRFDPLGDGTTAPIAVIQQRLAKDDLIDLVRRHGGEILELPARHEPGRRCSTVLWTDPRTEPGEVLAPEVHSAEYLADKERTMSARKFRAQYQQAVSAEGGEIFKVANWSWCSLGSDLERERPDGARLGPPRVLARRGRDGSLDLDWCCLSIDATNGATGPDASALGMGLVVAKGARTSVLADFTKGPATWAQTLVRTKSAILSCLRVLVKQRKLTVLLEKKAMGASEGAPLPTQLRDMIAEGFRWPDGDRAVVDLVLYEPTGKGSKEQRAEAVEPDHEAGMVELVDGAPWVKEFVEEFAAFGSGKLADDRVDYVSQAVDHHSDSAGEGALGALRRAMRGRRS
jgi:hypothetical protein